MKRNDHEANPLSIMRSYHDNEEYGKVRSKASPQVVHLSCAPDVMHCQDLRDNDTKYKSIDTKLVKPKRPLTGYNLFFKDERAKLINDSKMPDKRYSSRKSKKSQVMKNRNLDFKKWLRLLVYDGNPSIQRQN